jgi:hypothetical protein
MLKIKRILFAVLSMLPNIAKTGKDGFLGPRGMMSHFDSTLPERPGSK